MKFGSLFAGIGGFDLGLERAGMKCAWQVENDSFCQKVLKKHWPNVPLYTDIKNIKGDELETVELICGGFPCQPFSNAGNRRGKNDDRYLWPEMFRIIQKVWPSWIIGENVTGFKNLGLESTLIDLESAGYQVQTFNIPAVAVNAWHERQRLWIIAHSYHNSKSKYGFASNTKSDGSTPSSQTGIMRKRKDESTTFTGISDCVREGSREAFESRIRGKINGFSAGMDGVERLISQPKKHYGKRLKAIGNAVVPLIVEIIGSIIMHIDNRK
jgi:DNA (cytosine-5)-methyltransferase 1